MAKIARDSGLEKTIFRLWRIVFGIIFFVCGFLEKIRYICTDFTDLNMDYASIAILVSTLSAAASVIKDLTVA